MSEVHNKAEVYEDEIDLRELVLALWKNKYIIICMTLVAALLAGLFSVFMLTPEYRTRLNIIINMPDSYHTVYGDYTLPIKTNDQYINLITSNRVLMETIEDMGYDPGKVSIEGLRSRISIEGVGSTDLSKTNSFRVTVSASDPQEALKTAEALYENFVEFIDMMIREKAAEHYYNHYRVSLLTLEETLESNKALLKKSEELLKETHQTINQKEVLEDTLGALPDSIDFVVLDNIINENYFEIEKSIIERKQNIYSLENTIELHKEYLSQLEKEKENIAKYNDNKDTDKVETELTGMVSTSIMLPSPPVAPTRKSGPNHKRNVIFGLAAGLMLGLGTAYIKEYWFDRE